MGYGMSYQRYSGDPFLGGLLKGALKIGKGFLSGGPLGAASAGLGLIKGGPQRPQGTPVMPGGTLPGGRVTRSPGVSGFVARAIPGGATGYQVTGGTRRRRMNPGNAKALRRAIRRQDGFVKLARRALKGSGYSVVSKGSRRPRRDLGSGHTHVR